MRKLKNSIRLQSKTSLQPWKTKEDNRARDTTRDIKISTKESICYCESKYHKPCFDEECSKLVDRRKQVKLQWLQDPCEVNNGNLSNVRQEASRYFRNKKIEYLKDTISLNQTVRIMGTF
jgi:hypothetical protein